MHSVFDFDKKNNRKEALIYNSLFIIMLILIIVLFLLIKKKRTYENSFYFSGENGAILLANKEATSYLKDKRKIFIDDIEYDFIIEKIEKKDNNFLIEIAFSVKIDTSTDRYQLIIGEETILNYIIRIVKGE